MVQKRTDGEAQRLRVLGGRVKMLRGVKNYTQDDLRRFCRVSLRTIRGIEKGTQNPSLVVLMRLANAFHIDVPYLVFGTKEYK